MKLPESIKNQILEALKPLDPEKVILFGSYAWGEPTEESDIDLYVVTKDRFVPQDFKERIHLKLKVAYLIDPIRDSYHVDLIVHTMPMEARFVEMGSSFSKEIFSKGVRLR